MFTPHVLDIIIIIIIVLFVINIIIIIIIIVIIIIIYIINTHVAAVEFIMTVTVSVILTTIIIDIVIIMFEFKIRIIMSFRSGDSHKRKTVSASISYLKKKATWILTTCPCRSCILFVEHS